MLSPRTPLFAALLLVAIGVADEPKKVVEPPEGVLPVGADGKPLNLDFETGDLRDWTATGEAFKGQPIKGDTVHPRRADSRSQHQGQYWIGGYEKLGDKATGTLTSVPFKITHPWASFLVAGGPYPTETCVELVRNDTKEVFFRASGMEEENLRRVAVDLTKLKDKEMFIRVVDKHTGHWGHVNFDDFRFHSTKPSVPERPKPTALDEFKFAGLSPQKAAEAMTVPEGFSVTLFAGEPDVHQPIAFCLDDRGRLWVAEAYCYPTRRADKDANDRILIFEDTDGDGKFDKKTVFMEGLNLVSGLEVGFGGVWIGAVPYLMYVPIKDDKPGKPEILLDGWAYQDTHETLNTFTWGPDGWLYGCHGVFTHSRVGKPGTPDKDRIPINAGVWRYHPTKHIFEVFAHGTSNPWGLDFNDYGEAFVEACVIPHCFHIIQHARYHRQAGQHFDPYTYDDIKTIADHFHYVGATPHGGNNRSDSAGGGHAHCGLMCYLGGAWPETYRNQLFMGNIHGRRLNVDRLTARGSGYVASHGPDFLLANDAWARFINMRYGPDGNVYLIDWYDKQACHVGANVNAWDRSNGRIYKVSYRGTKSEAVDLSKKTDAELVELQLSKNDWYVRHARRLLAERHHEASQVRGANVRSPAIHAGLEKILVGNKDETRRLRALWALHVTEGLTAARLQKAMSDESPYVRAWAIQLAFESDQPAAELVAQLRTLAGDSSPVVRRYVASALLRPTMLKLPPLERSPILSKLFSYPEDFADHNLSKMYWYALEPLAAQDPERALARATYAAKPALLAFAARRVASVGTPEALAHVVRALDRVNDAEQHLAVLRGTQEALRGRRQVDMPKEWPDVFSRLSTSKDAEVRRLSLALAVTFGDARALDTLRETLVDTKADLARRQGALAALLDAGDKGLAPVLHKLIDEPPLRGAAILGLASYDDPKTPEIILGVFRSLNSEEKRAALTTLASRRAYGKALVEAIAAKKLAANEVPAEVVRQLRTLGDADIEKRLGEVWGIVRSSPAEKAKMIADHRRMLMTPSGPKPDLMLGRAIYAKTCQQCHTLFGVGGKVGPEITGANRANLDYLLENMLDPSAVIPKEYTATQITTKRGRSLLGLVKEETSAAVTLVTANETVVIPSNEIESRTPSTTSMMPDDLLKPLQEFELRSLVAYLQSPSQVAMLATVDNAKDLFNGKDLTGWDGDPKLWKVDNGEIVGTSPGIKRNEFLRSHLAGTDFRLTLKVKLTPNKENSGVQFRSAVLPDFEMKGPQADAGAGWWGKLYEENGRGLLWKESGEKHVKVEDWNEYVIEAVGTKVRTWINGQLCVDVDDAMMSRRGVFAFQIHSGGAMEVRFKDIKLEVLTPKQE